MTREAEPVWTTNRCRPARPTLRLDTATPGIADLLARWLGALPGGPVRHRACSSHRRELGPAKINAIAATYDVRYEERS
jgi:hypothetical protein